MFSWFLQIIQRPSSRHLVGVHKLSHSLLKTALYLAAIISLHTAAMITLEKLPFSDALWLTLTSITTVGYGDLSATTLTGRLATALLIYIGGIFVLAKMAGDYFDYRSEKRLRQQRGEWIWHMQNHIVIINTPSVNGVQYFSRLIEQFRSSRYADLPIQILTTKFADGLPIRLSDFGNIAHFHGEATDPKSLKAVNIGAATLVAVLAREEHNPVSDSRSFDILHRLRELNVRGQVLAECVDDNNRQRLLQAGADIVIRPMRAYPGMVVRSLVAPGSELIIENMFTSNSDEYQRFEITLSGLCWSDVVCRLMHHNLGTSIAYIDRQSDELICNPPASTPIDAKALILMIREEEQLSTEKLQQALKNG